jgi:transcription antitermination protein NusB
MAGTAGGKRRDARRLALVATYAMGCTGYDASTTLALMAELKAAWAVLPDFTRELVTHVHDHSDEIDRTVAQILQHWKLDRVAPVERALLRLACAEVDGFADIPPRVTLNEYIELAKYYSGGQAPGFINGVLDRLVHLKGKPDAGVQAGTKRAGRTGRG